MRIFGRLKKVASFVGVFGILIAIGLVLTSRTSAAPTGLPSGFSATTLINHSLGTPSSVRVAPDGRIFVFDLFGGIKIFKTGVGFNSGSFGSVSVNATGDRGLLGAVFDRDFANNPYLYIHYVGSDDRVRIGRFNASTDTGTNFQVLYTAPDASGFQHAGGGITMGPDNRIYFGIGDSGTPTNSQDLTKIHGKLHRINRDGSVPANPFAGQAGVANTVYAYGVRNPFRLTTDSLTGAIYVGDVGFNNWEEINLVQSGKNYGWAAQEGPCTGPCMYENPVYWYSHQFGTNNTNDSSIVAGPVYRGSLYPASYQGRMFVSDYVQGFIRTINPGVTSTAFNTFSTDNGTVIDMDVGPDGKLYFVTISSPVLYRLDYNGSGGGNAAPVAAASSNVTAGPAPLTVNFSSAGSSDPEGASLSYLWNFGDGTTSTQANPTKTYNNLGQYTVSLTVSDGVNNTPATPLTIKVGNQPAVTINSPTATTKYKGGDTINYSASAVDSSGNPISSDNIKTTVRLYHSDHSHPAFGPLTGGSGQFTIPKTGELSPDVWYRITVEATDSNGITGSSFVEIQPYKAQITVNTSPAGLNVVLDGSNHVIPPTVQGVVGMTRQIAAPSPQMLNGVQYVFDHWGDGGAQDHTFDFPMNSTTYTAYYVPATGGTTFENIAPNPSFEVLGSNNLPANWTASKWGTNNAVYTLEPTARTGNRSAKMQITSYTSGEDRLYHSTVNISPSTVYGVRYFYKGDVQTKAVADVTLVDGTHKYIWLGINQPSTGSDWREQNWSLTTPPFASKVVVNLYLTSAGYFQVDDFNLLAPTSGSPTTIAPVVTLSANPTTINAGSSTGITWSTTGTSPTCTASGAWNGLMGANGTLTATPSSTSTYTLTCTNSAGSDTKSVTVTVNPPTPPPTGNNIVPNPSFEIEDASHRPANWTSAKWGTNNAAFSLEHGSAFDGDHSAKTVITSHSSGEAQWYFAPQVVSPNTTYNLSLRTKSAGPTKVLVDITQTDNTHKYIWLGTLTASTDWREFTKSFTTTATTAKLTIGVYLTGVGSLQLDSASLTPPTTTPPVGTAPSITFTANPTTITAGGNSTLNWTSAGTSPVSCTASGAWSGSIGLSGSQTVSPAATATYTMTCTNSVGSDTKSVTITVNPTGPTPTPTPASLILNHSMADPFDASSPIYWYKGNWGNNVTAFSYGTTTGRTDSKSIGITISSYVDGDAKWFFEPVTITGGATYRFSNWYKSTAPTELLVEYTLNDGSKSYQWLGIAAAAADWTQTNYSITAPTNATKLTVMHILKANGNLQLDDYSLTVN